MKTYTPCPLAVRDCCAHVLKSYHPELDGVKLDLLFVAADTPDKPALSHGGYPADAVVRRMPLKDRAAGRGDAEIVLDRARWLAMKPEEQRALLDHELTHLIPVPGEPDSAGRPRLKLRKHDRQFGWFDEVARRHGQHSGEVQQAQTLLAEAQRDYFPFMADLPKSRRPAA